MIPIATPVRAASRDSGVQPAQSCWVNLQDFEAIDPTRQMKCSGHAGVMAFETPILRRKTPHRLQQYFHTGGHKSDVHGAS
jgi:hypothetical protein